MEPWKDLTSTATGALLTAALDITGGLIGPVCSAHRSLDTLAQAVRMIQAGTTNTELLDLTRPLWDMPTPPALLDGAIRELARLGDLHLSTGGHAQNLYAEGGHGHGHHHPAPEDTDPSPAQTRMAHHRSNALAHARDAERRLRSAASIARAFENALFRVRLDMPHRHGSPSWNTLTSRVLRLAQNAAIATALALHALRQMRNAVALEFHDACRDLNG